jgi:hypothetical protein
MLEDELGTLGENIDEEVGLSPVFHALADKPGEIRELAGAFLIDRLHAENSFRSKAAMRQGDKIT